MMCKLTFTPQSTYFSPFRTGLSFTFHSFTYLIVFYSFTIVVYFITCKLCDSNAHLSIYQVPQKYKCLILSQIINNRKHAQLR